MGTQVVGKWVFGDLERGKWGFRNFHVEMPQGGHNFAAGVFQKDWRYIVPDCGSEVGYG